MKETKRPLEVRETLPIHSCDRKDDQRHLLRVDGLVARPLELTVLDLEALSQENLTEDFACLEGWKTPDVKWRGVALQSVLALTGVNSDAKWVQASAAEFSVPLSLNEIDRALLAIGLGEDPLPMVHGGPVRLVVSGRRLLHQHQVAGSFGASGRARREHREGDCPWTVDPIDRLIGRSRCS
jgi:DMSO/TMAO reductase YedYZ molybdopterin-dependent catalytic subunit